MRPAYDFTCRGIHVGRLPVGPMARTLIRAATAEAALRIVTMAITTVNDDEARRHLQRLLGLIADRAALRKRRDLFAFTEYDALTRQIASLRDGAASVGDALEIVLPATATRRLALRPYPLVVSAAAALGVVFVSVFVRAWWVAERAARAR